MTPVGRGAHQGRTSRTKRRRKNAGRYDVARYVQGAQAVCRGHRASKSERTKSKEAQEDVTVEGEAQEKESQSKGLGRLTGTGDEQHDVSELALDV